MPNESQTRGMRLRIGFVSCGMLIAACSTTADVAQTSTVDEPAQTTTTTERPETTTTRSPVSTTTTIDQAVVDEAVATAENFLMARQERDLPTALTYLDHEVFMDWGPGQTYATLEAGLAWEDAFGIGFTLSNCAADPDHPTGNPIRCQLEVRTVINDLQTAVEGTDDNETDSVCVDIQVEAKITRAELTQGGGCEFSFWETTFLPFYEWMATAHPESNPDDMYDDRISPEGLALWTEYTEEFIDDHNS